MKQRNKKIKQLRFEKKKTYREIGQIYKISTERVRQICHQKRDKNELLKEIEFKYKKRFNDKTTFYDLKTDILELSKPNREKEKVVKRKILIDFLHDELNLPLYVIGDLLNRDHTTIRHSYYKET